MQRKKTFWASSRAKISVVWALTLTLIITIYLLIPKENERAIEAAFLVSTLLGKSIFTRTQKSDKEFCPFRLNRIDIDPSYKICKP